MTRDEAIDCLEGLKIYLKTEHIDQEAVDMAIEALQAEPVVRCKDFKWYSNQHLCVQLSRFGSVEPLADFYCAFGERREV